MAQPLEGRIVALAEGRQLEELAQMLENEGAEALRCPMVSILDTPDTETVEIWLRDLISDRFDLVVFFTGEGVRRLRGFAERAGLEADFLAALKRSYILTRGPKPVVALKELGLAASQSAPKPTTEGVISALREESLSGKTVAVQYYSESNPPLESFLAEAEATLASVLPYVYAPASDADRVIQLIKKLASGEVDVLVLTSSPQVDRLYEVAEKNNLQSELASGLQKVRVASIGPVVTETLKQRGAPVDICPEQGFVMKNLVKHIKADLDQRSD